LGLKAETAVSIVYHVDLAETRDAPFSFAGMDA
jgi:hypothetical protein